MKRHFDIFFSVLTLIVLSPILLIIAITIKLTSAGPIFYCSKRVGEKGKLFDLIKFRSMVVDAPQKGPNITRNGDNRITNIGKILRKYKLDELPQFFNVLKGDMSIVGPRPEDPAYVARYSPEQLRVLCVKPGITSLASIKYRDEEQILTGENWQEKYINEIMPAKLSIDLEYIKHQSLLNDLYIIYKTVFAVFNE